LRVAGKGPIFVRNLVYHMPPEPAARKNTMLAICNRLLLAAF
jgi:hypothetical protein